MSVGLHVLWNNLLDSMIGVVASGQMAEFCVPSLSETFGTSHANRIVGYFYDQIGIKPTAVDRFDLARRPLSPNSLNKT